MKAREPRGLTKSSLMLKQFIPLLFIALATVALAMEPRRPLLSIKECFEALMKGYEKKTIDHKTIRSIGYSFCSSKPENGLWKNLLKDDLCALDTSEDVANNDTCFLAACRGRRYWAVKKLVKIDQFHECHFDDVMVMAREDEDLLSTLRKSGYLFKMAAKRLDVEVAREMLSGKCLKISVRRIVRAHGFGKVHPIEYLIRTNQFKFLLMLYETGAALLRYDYWALRPDQTSCFVVFVRQLAMERSLLVCPEAMAFWRFLMDTKKKFPPTRANMDKRVFMSELAKDSLSESYSALCFAITHRNWALVDLLLENGASLSEPAFKTYDGKVTSGFELAQEQGTLGIVVEAQTRVSYKNAKELMQAKASPDSVLSVLPSEILDHITLLLLLKSK